MAALPHLQGAHEPPHLALRGFPTPLPQVVDSTARAIEGSSPPKRGGIPILVRRCEPPGPDWWTEGR